MAYQTPSHITVVFFPNGGFCYYQCIKHFPESAAVLSQHKHMTERDARTWCDREYHGVPVTFTDTYKNYYKET